MNSTGNGGPDIREINSSEAIGEFFLDSVQLARARALGWDQRRIDEFQTKKVSCLLFLSKVRGCLTMGLADFFEQVAKTFTDNPSHKKLKRLECDMGNIFAIKHMIRDCITDSIIRDNTMLMAPYFTQKWEEQDFLTYVYMAFVLHLWYEYPELTGRFPTREEISNERYSAYTDVICRTYLEACATGKVRCLIPYSQGGMIGQDMVELPGGIAKNGQFDLPKTFVNIGAIDRFSLADNRRALEEMLVIGGRVLTEFIIKPGWIDAVIDASSDPLAINDMLLSAFPKHTAFIEDKYAKLTQRTKKDKKPKLKPKVLISPASLPASPAGFLRSGIGSGEAQVARHPIPELKPYFTRRLSSGEAISGSIGQIITWTKSPEEFVLWIWAPKSDESGEWYSYNSTSILDIGYIRDAEYVFCYGRLGERPEDIDDKYKVYTVVTKTIKATINQVASSANKVITEVPRDADVRIVGIQNDSLTDDYVFSIMERIDTSNYQCSLISDAVVSLDFEPESRVCSYDIATQKIIWSNLPKGVIQEELDSILCDMISDIARKYIDTNFTATLSHVQSRTQNGLKAFETGKESHIDFLWKQTRDNGRFLGGAVLFDKILSDSIIQRYQQDGITLQMSRVNIHGKIDPRGMEMLLQGTFHGMICSVYSIGISPYCVIEFQNDKGIFSDSVVGLFENLLKSLLLLVGLTGHHKTIQAQQGISKTNQRGKGRINDIDVVSLFSQGYSRPRLEWKRLDKVSQDQIKIAIKQLDEGRAKTFYSGGFSDTDGYYTCSISSRKGWTDVSDDMEVVITEEKISTVPDGLKGNDYIYDMIDANPRLQKYMILRMIATYLGTDFEGKSPFSNSVADYCRAFFYRLDEVTRNIFVLSVTSEGGSAGKALELMHTPNGERIRIFDDFITGMRDKNSKVYDLPNGGHYVKPEGSTPLQYSRPMTLSLADILAYKREIDA